QAARNPGNIHGRSEEGARTSDRVRPPERFAHTPSSFESRCHPDAGIHAWNIRGGRIQLRSSASAGTWGVLLDHTDSEVVAERAHRIETARVQQLRLAASHDPRSHAGPLRST